MPAATKPLSSPDKSIVPRAPGSSSGRRAVPDKVCIFAGGTGQFGSELQALLRGRLQLAALVTLFPVAIFLFRNILQHVAAGPIASVGVALQLLSFVINAGLAALLWSRFEFSSRTLRLIELSLFGLFAIYFSWTQFDYSFSDLMSVLSRHGRDSDVH